ncbi:MAG: RNase adapter RapZ [Gammaproteobacteria bacterium]|nr:RNase adapter RapZ [Gammaproteobacteria bacterium]MBU1416214.1 RNase adapter RapZ [Gammaproteobacteria bacterium]
MQLILISGLSGSGKSIVLNTLEDLGFFCVDNLPLPLLPQLVEQLGRDGYARAAVAMDMRGGTDVATFLPQQLRDLSTGGDIDLRFIFLDARDDILIQRFSETRRRHPLAADDTTLAEAIAHEREALDVLAGLGHHIDTSNLRPNGLRAFVKDFVEVDNGAGLILMFESFGFKHGLPMDADLVFDVRCLPNPHYDPLLRPQTGLDTDVIAFLDADADVQRMVADIGKFVDDWLPAYVRDNRSYLTIALGCTGGQHRSVYIAERLAARFRDAVRVLVRHRSLVSA